MRVGRWAIGATVLVFTFIVLADLWHEIEARAGLNAERAEALLVLGGGMNAEQILFTDSTRRIDRAAELWKQGRAPLIVISGGVPLHKGPSTASVMAERAVEAGVPRSAILLEEDSHSTLQNAILSREILARNKIRSVIIVTDAYHMARSRLSMAWAGVPVVGHESSVMARERPDLLPGVLVREVAALVFNAGRVGAWHLLGQTGQTEEERLPMLVQLNGWSRG